MRDEKRFLADVARAGPPAVPMLSRADWEALPLAARVCDRLVEILMLASELRAELEAEEALPLLWMAPEIERVLERTDDALQRLAS